MLFPYFDIFKIFSQYPLLILIIGAIAYYALIHAKGETSRGLSQRAPTATKSESSPPSGGDLGLRLKTRLEELYFEKKISLDLMNDLLSLLKGSPLPVGPSPLAPSPAPAQPVVRPPAPLGTCATHSAPLRIESPSVKVEDSSGQKIKTLLLTGFTMVVLATYLFVRSYWEQIPNGLKFSALLVATIGAYLAGQKLRSQKRMPKTAETLAGLGVTGLLFCVYAFNSLMLANPIPLRTAWLIGFALMAAAAAGTLTTFATNGMGLLFALATVAAIQVARIPLGLSVQGGLLSMSLGIFGLAVIAIAVPWAEVRRALLAVVHGVAALIALTFALQGFFWTAPSQWVAASSLAVLAGLFILESRQIEATWAYPAGFCLMGAALLLLHQLGVPSYQFGLYFIPAAMLAIGRAWTFERQGRKALAQPYFHLSQVAMAGSLLSVSAIFRDASGYSFSLACLTIAAAVIAYGVMGFLYRSPFFTIAGALSILYLAAVAIFRFDMAFEWALLLLGGIGFAMGTVGLLMSETWDEQLRQPLGMLGIGVLSLTLVALAGRWADLWWFQRELSLTIPAQQLTPALWVAGLGTAAYLLLARLQRQALLVYPALASVSLFYLLLLQKLAQPIDAWHLSWILPVTLGMSYALELGGSKTLARVFAVWGEALFGLLAILLIAGVPNSAPGSWVAWLALFSFLPSLYFGRGEGVACAVAAAYLTHWLTFTRVPHDHALAAYAVQLVFVNSIVLFVRAGLTLLRPQTNVNPLRAAVAFFALVSLLGSLTDMSVAWQVYLAHGVLALLASLVLYEGRYLGVGTTLLLLTYELFIQHQYVSTTEAFTLPAGFFLLVWGFVQRDEEGIRDGLYMLGQLVLFAPSFIYSLPEVWGSHGLYLAATSLAVFLFGLQFRQRALVLVAGSAMLLNGVVQSRIVLRAIPRWVALAFSGGLLVSLGAIFEFRREWVNRVHGKLRTGLAALK